MAEQGPEGYLFARQTWKKVKVKRLLVRGRHVDTSALWADLKDFAGQAGLDESRATLTGLRYTRAKVLREAGEKEIKKGGSA